MTYRETCADFCESQHGLERHADSQFRELSKVSKLLAKVCLNFKSKSNNTKRTTRPKAGSFLQRDFFKKSK